MSGYIFQPMENLDEPCQSPTRNPLLCYLCNDPYEDPCMFGCFHSFCARCLRGRASDNKISCPLCGYVHALKEGSSLPSSDLLLKFMIEASTEEKCLCSNCDSPAVQMFFCNTCMQPMCVKCREETHRAKMFAAHEMVLLTNRVREVHKRCPLHGEPYIMFSSEKRIMLCISCFRGMRIESRGHCLDLETAYKQSCKKLDLRVQAFRELQNSMREGVTLFKGLVIELKSNTEKEKQLIEDMYAILLERLAETKSLLLQKVASQQTDKEATFREQLKYLSTMLPTLHVHLVIASAFLASANKFEFLELAYVLMDRLKSIIQKKHPLHPTQSAQLDTAYKSEFFKALEPLLYTPAQRNTVSAPKSNGVTACVTGTSCPGSPGTFKLTPTHLRRANGLNGAKVKFIDARGQFAEHCKEFENAHRDLLQRFEQLKTGCQELHRDLTKRHCLADKDDILRLGTSIENVQNQLDSHYNTLEQKLPILEKHWEESVDRINNEQDLYQAQLHDVMRLKQESQHLKVITSQLTSFVSSIAEVTERLVPKLDRSNQTSEQHLASLLEEIHAVQPDSQHRVDAIRGAEEERHINLANRTNPLDSELIKTKGLLRAPALRDTAGDRRRRLDACEKSDVSATDTIVCQACELSSNGTKSSETNRLSPDIDCSIETRSSETDRLSPDIDCSFDTRSSETNRLSLATDCSIETRSPETNRFSPATECSIDTRSSETNRLSSGIDCSFNARSSETNRLSPDCSIDTRSSETNRLSPNCSIDTRSSETNRLSPDCCVTTNHSEMLSCVPDCSKDTKMISSGPDCSVMNGFTSNENIFTDSHSNGNHIEDYVIFHSQTHSYSG